MADSTNNIEQVTPSQNDKEVTINELFAAASPAMEYARDPATSDGFKWGYLNNRWGGFTGANGSFDLTPEADNYIVVKRADGVCSVSTNTTNWNNTIEYARAYKVLAYEADFKWEDYRAGPGGVFGPEVTQVIGLSLSNMDSDITVKSSANYFRFLHRFTLTRPPIITLFEAQGSGSTFTVDQNKNGTSILSTKMTIDNGEYSSETAAVAPVVSDAVYPAGSVATWDIDQIGVSGAKGLQVQMWGVYG